RGMALGGAVGGWGSPPYHLACRRLREEAELACDARVLDREPKARGAYAAALIDVCSRNLRPSTPSPALGLGDHGRAFERRLTMILRPTSDVRWPNTS